MNFNKVLLGGNLTRDPEVRAAGNSQVAGFGLAVNRRWKGKDGESKEETTFVDVECWGRTAELVAQYLTKGRPVFIEGRLQLDSWEDKEGNKRSKLKVVADSVQFLGSKGDNAAASSTTASVPASAPVSAGADDSDIPF